LDDLPEIKICTAYHFKRQILQFMPTDPELLEIVEPVYETMPGWQSSTKKARRWWDLPSQARNFLERYLALIAQAPGLKEITKKAISVGPSRDEIILL